MAKLSTHKSQTWPAISSSAIVAPVRKPKGLLAAGVRFQHHRIGGWENAGSTMCRVTLASTKPSVALSVTTIQGREDTCRGVSQAGLKRQTSERILRHTEEWEKKDGNNGSAVGENKVMAGQNTPALVIRKAQSTENVLIHIFPHHTPVLTSMSVCAKGVEDTNMTIWFKHKLACHRFVCKTFMTYSDEQTVYKMCQKTITRRYSGAYNFTKSQQSLLKSKFPEPHPNLMDSSPWPILHLFTKFHRNSPWCFCIIPAKEQINK